MGYVARSRRDEGRRAMSEAERTDQRDGILLIHCTCPDRASAGQIADVLVDRGLAACVSVVPGVRSTYRWQGELQHDDEWLLLIKSHRARYPELEQALVALHPNELPEIIAVPIEMGLSGYIEWVEQCTANQS